MKTLKIGITTLEEYRHRTIAIAKGELKPSAGDPRLWFTSIESAAKILSKPNRELLALIAREKPGSLGKLAELSGRAKSNLSRTLKTMERYGLVQLTKGRGGAVTPTVAYQDIKLEVPVTQRLPSPAEKRSQSITDLVTRTSVISRVAELQHPFHSLQQSTAVRQALLGAARLQELASSSAVARHMLEGPRRLTSYYEQAIGISKLIEAAGGVSRIQQRAGAMSAAIAAAGGLNAVYERLNISQRVLEQSKAVQESIRRLAGVGSFGSLAWKSDALGLGSQSQIAQVLESAKAATQLGLRGERFAEAMRRDWPSLYPQMRRPTVAEIMAAPVGPLASRAFATSALLSGHHRAMRNLRSAWANASDPLGSVRAFGEARALARIVSDSPPASRGVIVPMREELGDFREVEAPPQEVVSDPVLRTAFRLELGFSPEMANLAPVAAVTVAGWLGMKVRSRTDVDENDLVAVLSRHARHIELKLRRFIERRMAAKCGSNWMKQRVSGNVREVWHERRELDRINGRVESPLFDYADFSDYQNIITQGDNWRDVFAEVFKIKTAIAETLRRLSVVRNPVAHFRVVTIEDLLTFAFEGRHIERWLDDAETIQG